MRLPGTGTPVRLAPGIWRIPTFPGDGINSFLLQEADGTATLVDAGLPWTSEAVLAGLRAIEVPPRAVTRIVLTHAHFDHAGGVGQVLSLAAADGADVHERDADYLRRGVPPTGDLTTRTARLLGRARIGRFPRVASVTTFTDGALLPVAGGLEVVHTPGHTPGHVSLLHPATGVLITGDAIFNVRGLRWPLRSSCTDPALNRRSADRLGDLEFEVAAFTHGPEVRDGARSAVRAFLRGRAYDTVRPR